MSNHLVCPIALRDQSRSDRVTLYAQSLSRPRCSPRCRGFDYPTHELKAETLIPDRQIQTQSVRRVL